MRIVVGALLLALVLPASAESQRKVWNEAEIAQAVGIKTRPNGLGRYFMIDNEVDCGVAAVMKTEAAVRLYETSGDVVATNPSKTAGIKIMAKESRACLEAATRRMETLN